MMDPMQEKFREFYNLPEVKAQREYCDAHYLPHFAPQDGYCYSCGRYIYGPNGYSLEQASTRLITGCPFCNASYCD